MASKRIDYFDLMKGVCIIMVVLHHCHLLGTDWLRCIRMPLYFMLSGMFFKRYSGFADFVTRKFNKLVIPCVTFFALSELIFQRTNVPLWFLVSLFLSYIIYFFIEKYFIEKTSVKVLIPILFIALSYVSYLMSNVQIENKILNVVYTYIVISIATMPYFYLSTWLKSKGFLVKEYKIRTLLIVGVVGMLICYFSAVHGINYREAKFEQYPLYYICAVSGVAVIWALCYKIKTLPYVSYIGRYSIIVLVTHYPIIHVLLDYNVPNIVIAGILFIVEPVFIYLLKRYAPYVTAQKDVIKYDVENKKIRFALKDE